MCNRTYRSLLGLAILVGLYLAQPALIYGLVAMLLLAGISNFRILKLIGQYRDGVANKPLAFDYFPEHCNPQFRFNCESQRVWPMVGSRLLITLQPALVFPLARGLCHCRRRHQWRVSVAARHAGDWL